MYASAGYNHSSPTVIMIKYTDWELEESLRGEKVHGRRMYYLKQYKAPNIKPIKVAYFGNCRNNDCGRELTDWEFRRYQMFCYDCGDANEELNRLI